MYDAVGVRFISVQAGRFVSVSSVPATIFRAPTDNGVPASHHEAWRLKIDKCGQSTDAFGFGYDTRDL